MSESIGKLILRLGMGGFMIPHGFAKLQNAIAKGTIQFPDPLGIGEVASFVLCVFAEFLCCIFIVLGWKTKLAAIPPAFTMLVAAFIIHASDPFSKQEFPLIYFTGFLALFFLGSGDYSVDQWLFRKRYK